MNECGKSVGDYEQRKQQRGERERGETMPMVLHSIVLSDTHDTEAHDIPAKAEPTAAPYEMASVSFVMGEDALRLK